MLDNQSYQEEYKSNQEQKNDVLDKEYNKNSSFLGHLNKGQKIAFFSLLIFAVVAVAMWVMQFKNNLKSPFYHGGEEQTQTANLQQEDSESSLRNKDSDGDGLSDWDELYFYKTSPYLEDSDSDGFSDKNEIDSSNDPNCPTGRDCYSDSNLNNASADSAKQDLTQNIFSEITSDGAQQTLQEANALLNAPNDASYLRKILLDSGFSQEMLDQISDEDLIKAYQETVKTQQ